MIKTSIRDIDYDRVYNFIDNWYVIRYRNESNISEFDMYLLFAADGDNKILDASYGTLFEEAGDIFRISGWLLRKENIFRGKYAPIGTQSARRIHGFVRKSFLLPADEDKEALLLKEAQALLADPEEYYGVIKEEPELEEYTTVDGQEPVDWSAIMARKNSIEGKRRH